MNCLLDTSIISCSLAGMGRPNRRPSQRLVTMMTRAEVAVSPRRRICQRLGLGRRHVKRDPRAAKPQVHEHHLALERLNVLGIEHAFRTVGCAVEDRMAAPGAFFRARQRQPILSCGVAGVEDKTI